MMRVVVMVVMFLFWLVRFNLLVVVVFNDIGVLYVVLSVVLVF